MIISQCERLSVDLKSISSIHTIMVVWFLRVCVNRGNKMLLNWLKVSQKYSGERLKKVCYPDHMRMVVSDITIKISFMFQLVPYLTDTSINLMMN